MSGVSIDYMREKLREWNPHWNVDRFTTKQIAALYRKEQQVAVRRYAALFSLPTKPKEEDGEQLTLF